MDDTKRAAEVARYFAALGLSPLPSRPDAKRPDLYDYRKHQTEPLSADRLADWGVPNIQLMCGVRAYGPVKVIVVDRDGERAEEVWAAMRVKHGGHEPTWEVVTGSGGRHTYFTLPPGTASCPTGILWGLWDTWGDDGEGKWAKHQEVKILGDGALAIAPPSIHVETQVRYEFLRGTGPRMTRLPSLAPQWLLAVRRLTKPSFGSQPRASRETRPPAQPDGRRSWPNTSPTRNSSAGPEYLTRNEVLERIPDKLALACGWGLRLAGQVNANGWVSCYAVGRDERNPSASFHAGNGVYMDMRDGKPISMFDLGVALGQFGSWQECKAWCQEVSR